MHEIADMGRNRIHPDGKTRVQAYRERKRQAGGRTVSIILSEQAHKLLKNKAGDDGVTLSEAVEVLIMKYL